MKELYETQEPPKRAFLVEVQEKGDRENGLDELSGLADVLGLTIAGGETVTVRERNSKFILGTGKAGELAEKAGEAEADCLIFDGDLSPAQQRNWERLTGIPALDRQELIIQIFASRAKTREAEVQVELAELSYALPRLRHKYIDLSRQRGGSYGAKGAGETRFETDRRRVEKRIAALEQELKEVRKKREVRRKKRERQGIPACALVGYTNAGKSSLLNALTNADALVEDKRFATLDTTARQIVSGSGCPLIIIDTVGFIRRLPHALVDAFRSTLEEAAEADLLLHLADASDPEMDRYIETTQKVLQELGAEGLPTIMVFNKIDRVEDPEILASLQERYADGVLISAKGGLGLDALVRRIEERLAGEITRFRFPVNRQDLPSLLHRTGSVISEHYEDTFIAVEARISPPIREQLKEYIIP
jgi:GTP-binding protein HflX